ncbi:hypothetical protein DNK34_03795 [Pseudomonas dryadis]|uniref:Uncharacterized protein n=2 Tax=Pseudomonadales TaxID=72274 RepID=A0ABY1ZEX2_9GAMM|nr:hypothetical protein DNK34_03795 [Pseudomonas dryadis]TBV18275.1 hypothetical protein DNK41_09490 [Pseudomonas sp. FRB 230]
MLLMSIIGLGLVYTTSRVSISQKDMNLHNLVVSKLREELQAGNCNSGSFQAIQGGETFTINSHPRNVSLAIGSGSVEQSMCALSVDSTSLGGRICVGAVPCDN